MTNNLNTNEYVLGDEKAELKRLASQAKIFDADTAAILRRAGLSSGMRVLDLGCGVGDVSMIAGAIVGSRGSVLGIDRSEVALGVARGRTRAEGFDWVEFARRDLLETQGVFDAVIGRFILLHFREPVDVVRAAKRALAPDGILAFAEMDIGSTVVTPDFPALNDCLGWIRTLYHRSGLHPDMGSKLYATFRDAGMTPALSAACHIEGGTVASGLAYIIETLRTMRPGLVALGIVDEATFDVDKLGARLAAEAAAGDYCVIFPRLVGAWARV